MTHNLTDTKALLPRRRILFRAEGHFPAMGFKRHNRCADRAHAGGTKWAVKFGSVKITLGQSGRAEVRQTLRRIRAVGQSGRESAAKQSGCSVVRVHSGLRPDGRSKSTKHPWPCRFTRQGHALDVVEMATEVWCKKCGLLRQYISGGDWKDVTMSGRKLHEENERAILEWIRNARC